MNSPESLQSVTVESLVDEFLTRKGFGESIDIEEFASAFPAFEDELLAVLPTVEFLESNFSTKTIPDEYAIENIPETLKAKYKIGELIGQGGMGVVYDAVHHMRSKVALKVMRPEKAETDRKRFIREASIASKLHHTNIVPVFDFGDIDNLLYLSMKRIVGPNLYEVLECRNSDSEAGNAESSRIAQKLDNNWSMVARVGYEVASALDYAHKKGVLHRDIKPANLIFDNTDKVWVTDFGLAKMKLLDSSLTRSNNAVGTLRYMAPEQIDNFCDERTDVYSLGITLYEMTRSLTGRYSFFYSRHPLPRPSEVNPDIPKGLEKAILKACMPEPEDRYQTAGEFAAELAKYCDRRAVERKPSLGYGAVVQLACMALLASLIWAGSFLPKKPTINVVNTVHQIPINPVIGSEAKQVFDEASGITTLTSRIAHGSDDAEEWLQGEMYLRSGDLEMTWDEGPQILALRFRYCGIPQNAEIVSAHIQFTADEADIGETNLTIQCENSKESKNFSCKAYDLTNRKRFDTTVHWKEIPAWKECEKSKNQQTPELASIVQEAVSQDYWTTESSLVFLISGEGKRTAVAYDGSIKKCPKLVVEFKAPSPNQFASAKLKK